MLPFKLKLSLPLALKEAQSTTQETKNTNESGKTHAFRQQEGYVPREKKVNSIKKFIKKKNITRPYNTTNYVLHNNNNVL
jgi:hypothetical protein